MKEKKKLIITITSLILVCAVAVTMVLTGIIDVGKIKSVMSFGVQSDDDMSVPLDMMSTVPTSSDNTGDTSLAEVVKVSKMTKGSDVRTIGARLSPSDYYTAGDTSEAVSAKLDSIMKQYIELHLDSVQLVLFSENNTIFPSESYSKLSEFDLLKLAVSAAKDNGLRVLGEFSATAADAAESFDLSDPIHQKSVLAAVDELCKYELDGFFLSGLSLQKNQCTYMTYLSSGGGSGYSAYRNEKLSSAVNQITLKIAEKKPDAVIGLIAPPVWRSKEEDPAGITVPANYYHSLRDGSADILNWLKNGYFNSVLVENQNTMSDGTLSFKAVSDWWSENCPDFVSLNFLQYSSKVGGGGGWSNPDELLSELRYLKNKSSNGTVLDSFAAFAGDKTNSTEVVKKHLNGEIDDSQQLRDLELSSPTKQDSVVNISTVTISGKSDPLFPITLNGETLERNSIGGFSITKSLNLGLNTFTIVHKGVTKKYNVTYKLILLKEVSPSGTTTLPGGSILDVSATARSGSTVKCTLAGKTITLSAGSSNSEEGTAAGSEFVKYKGEFSIPSSSDKTKTIGTLSFSASYNGQSETKAGATVKVEKLSMPAPSSNTTPSGGATAPSSVPDIDVSGYVFYPDDVSDVIKDIPKNASGTIAEVTSLDAEVLKPLPDTTSESHPDNAFLPKGTVDYCSASYGNDIKWRQLNYGKRIIEYSNGKYGAMTFIKTYTGTLPSNNTVTTNHVSSGGRHTIVTLDVNWKAPFTVNVPTVYPKNSASKRDYSVTESNLTYKYIDITFAYAIQGQGRMEFANNSIFNGSQWIKNSSSYTLRLFLRNPGKFYGWLAEYNAQGQLEFSFLNPVKISGTQSGSQLSGVKILLDPGHDNVMSGARGNGLKEEVTVLALAKSVREKLQARGATVVFTRTDESAYYSLTARRYISQQQRPNIFVSIHRNAADSAAAHGYESYYYNPWSMPLAKSMMSSCGDFWKFSAGDTVWNRGDKWAAFTVMNQTFCPAILNEEGFITSTGDSNRMTGDNISKNADNIVKGIVNYLLTQ